MSCLLRGPVVCGEIFCKRPPISPLDLEQQICTRILRQKKCLTTLKHAETKTNARRVSFFALLCLLQVWSFVGFCEKCCTPGLVGPHQNWMDNWLVVCQTQPSVHQSLSAHRKWFECGWVSCPPTEHGGAKKKTSTVRPELTFINVFHCWTLLLFVGRTREGI